MTDNTDNRTTAEIINEENQSISASADNLRTADNTGDKPNNTSNDGEVSAQTAQDAESEKTPSFGGASPFGGYRAADYSGDSQADDFAMHSGDQQTIPVDEIITENTIRDDSDIVPEYLNNFSEENPLKRISAKLPNERESAVPAENLRRILSGALFGIACGLLFIALYLSDLLPEAFVTLLSFVCAWLVSGYVNDYVRLLTSLLFGGKVYYLRLFCLRININVPDEVSAKRKVQIVFPSGDRALSLPPVGEKISKGEYIACFGMNIAALIFSVLLSVVAAIISGSAVCMAICMAVCLAVSAGFLLRLLYRLFGGIRDGIPSDGTVLHALITNSPYTAGYIKLCVVYSEMCGGTRPRDIEIPEIGIYIPTGTKKLCRIFPQSSPKKLAREAMNFASEGDELAVLVEEKEEIRQLDIPSSSDESAESAESDNRVSENDKIDGSDILRRYPGPVDDNPLIPDFTYLFYLKELDSLSGENLFRYVKILLKKIEYAPEYLRNEIYREACFAYTIGHNPIAAADMYRLCDKNDDLPTLRMRAWYTYLVLENPDEAEEICDYALDCSAKRIRRSLTHTPGRDLAEMLLFERLKSELNRVQ